MSFFYTRLIRTPREYGNTFYDPLSVRINRGALVYFTQTYYPLLPRYLLYSIYPCKKPLVYFTCQNEAFKWSGRSRFLFEKQDYHLAELCASFALHFRVFSPSAGAQPLLCRALSRYNLGNPNFQSDINQVKQLDKKFAKVRRINSSYSST